MHTSSNMQCHLRDDLLLRSELECRGNLSHLEAGRSDACLVTCVVPVCTRCANADARCTSAVRAVKRCAIMLEAASQPKAAVRTKGPKRRAGRQTIAKRAIEKAAQPIERIDQVLPQMAWEVCSTCPPDLAAIEREGLRERQCAKRR